MDGPRSETEDKVDAGRDTVPSSRGKGEDATRNTKPTCAAAGGVEAITLIKATRMSQNTYKNLLETDSISSRHRRSTPHTRERAGKQRMWQIWIHITRAQVNVWCAVVHPNRHYNHDAPVIHIQHAKATNNKRLSH